MNSVQEIFAILDPKSQYGGSPYLEIADDWYNGGAMEELKKTLSEIKHQRNPHLHSELHLLVDEVRQRFGETATKGVGSFSFYLGFFKRLGVAKVRRILAEVIQAEVDHPEKLFWWKVKQELKR